jgi:PAS domain S-box-containing protein
LPPLRPAAFFWAVVPPWLEFERELPPPPDFLPPRLEAPGEFAIRAARCFDIPFSFSFSYCFSFLTLGRFPGMCTSLRPRNFPTEPGRKRPQSLRSRQRGVSEQPQAREDFEAAKADLRGQLDAERVRYRDLFEWAPDPYLVTDPTGKILEANRASERLLGTERRFLLGESLERLLADHERRPLRIMLARLPNLDVVRDWELALCDSVGRTFPAAVTASCMRDSGGRVTSLRWLIRDISERKRVEEQVVSANIELERRMHERTAALEEVDRERQETLARLEAVVDQIPAAIVIADATSGELVTANEHAERLLRDVLGDHATLDSWLSVGFHTDGTPYRREERPIIRALESGQTEHGEQIEFFRLDGSKGVFEISAAPVRDRDGKVIAAVSAYWDITERERQARAEREFITNAAHELRTPLAALASAVEVLQAGAKNEEFDRDRFLGHVEQQCDRLQRLVRSLLLLARAQSGQEAAEPEVIDVCDLLDAVAALFPAERIRVDVECDPDTTVLANRDLAEQALLNLLSNAVRYAPEGEIVLRASEQNGFVSLEVLDSGPGMAPEQRERAVERFYRGQIDDAEGFGLGLSIASQAAEALNGRLEIEPREPKGTRARLMLRSAHD